MVIVIIMNNNKSKFSVAGSGIGIGYTSIMIIFIVICLTLLAVLSYTSSNAEEILNTKTQVYMSEYYTADGTANEILAKIDDTIYNCIDSGLFDMTFEGAVSEIDGVTVVHGMNGYTVSYKTDINDKQYIYTELSVSENPEMSCRYNIKALRTVNTDKDNSYDKPLNVWDGNF